MKSNFLRLLIISVLFFNYSFCQEEEKEVKLFSDFQFGGNLKIFNGNNFLSDAHNSIYTGFHLEINAIEYNNFIFGGIYENNISKVEKKELAGNFDNISLNHFAGYIGYKYNLYDNHLTFNPKLLFGDIKTKQKASGYYANNNGNYWGIIGQVNYNISTKFAVFGSIGYNFYKFKVVTSEEYEDYFNKSTALNFSLGIKF